MKKLILILISAFSILNTTFLFAQEIEWQNTIGGSDFDGIYSIQQTSDGGYIIGGNSWSPISGDKTENSIGQGDFWVFKLNSLGNILWQNTIGGTGDDAIFSVKETADGGFILGGVSSSPISGDKTEDSIGGSDCWMVKINASGNIQWQNTFGGTLYDGIYEISLTTDGGFIIGANSRSNISGDKTEDCIGGDDFWVIKLDSIGNIQWQNTIGGTGGDLLESIFQTPDGGYLTGGVSYSNSSGDKSENAIGGNNSYGDYWVVKLDSAGAIQWENTIGGNNQDVLRSIVQTTDGNFLCGGYSQSDISGDKTENSNGYIDNWIFKLDVSGNIIWQNTFGGGSDDYLNSLVQSPDGSLFCGGMSYSNISGDKTENSIGNTDYWLLKLDSLGNIIWQNNVGGSNADNFSTLSLASNGGCIAGGISYSNISGDKTENILGHWDMWIVKLSNTSNSITGKSYIDLNSNQIKDLNENGLTNNKITDINTGGFSYTGQNGIFYIPEDTGAFTIIPTQINYYNVLPSSHTAAFNGNNQIDSLNDFAFQPQGVFNDLCITITPLTNFRAGFNAGYLINYGNYGTTSLSGDIIFFPDTNIAYVSSNVPPTSITLDSVIWNTGMLAPFQTGNIFITVQIVDSGLPVNTLINSSVRIEPVANDANPGCNYSHWEVYTTGSYDPNDILVSEDTLTTTQLSTAPYLDYIIRFQNTGNDTAFTVKVLNPIDTNKLELNTIEFVNASHPVNLNWINYQRNMEFRFDNILLPDSNINEPMSHGFVHYRLQPKTTLLAGDSVTNNAYIYFDFNSPVATNTAVTKIVLNTDLTPSPSPGERGALQCFPNPTANELTVTGLAFDVSDVIILSDLLGKPVITKTISQSTSNIKLQTSKLANGMYVLTVKTKAGVTGRKVVVQR